MKQGSGHRAWWWSAVCVSIAAVSGCMQTPNEPIAATGIRLLERLADGGGLDDLGLAPAEAAPWRQLLLRAGVGSAVAHRDLTTAR